MTPWCIWSFSSAQRFRGLWTSGRQPQTTILAAVSSGYAANRLPTTSLLCVAELSSKTWEAMEGRHLPATKGFDESGLPENDSNELTDAEHTTMQVGTHADVTATRVRGRKVQALCQKAPRLTLRHETTRMPGLREPDRG